jgi:hypothetical protein
MSESLFLSILSERRRGRRRIKQASTMLALASETYIQMDFLLRGSDGTHIYSIDSYLGDK